MAVASASGIQMSAVMKQVATVASISPRSSSKGFCGVRHMRRSPWRSSIAKAMPLTAT
ncbi:hypothetical protein D9M68_876170 [compost metagenome]